MIACLAAPMGGDRVTALPYDDSQHHALKAACAEDRDIWSIYANDFGPAGFDAAGRPMGMQLIGRPRGDLAVLRAAAAYEALLPWAAGASPS